MYRRRRYRERGEKERVLHERMGLNTHQKVRYLWLAVFLYQVDLF